MDDIIAQNPSGDKGLGLQDYLNRAGLLDRFEARAIAWTERVGIRWIELEGELFTLVSELERKKGVEAGDFVRGSGLEKAHEEKPHEPARALQRLLQLPGVKRASVPTAFTVEGGYALSCGGPGAKAGITALVRRQVPEWALACYTLVNVPLALAYLQHGRSDVAKATRDLTIGTTIDVGREAAARENATVATKTIGGLAKLVAMQNELLSYVSGLEEQVHEVDAEVKRVDGRVGHLEGEVEEVKTQFKSLQSHRIYLFVRVKDLTVKIGFTTDIERRRREHEKKGFQFISDMQGVQAFETEIKQALRKKGFAPKNGTEQYHLTPELVEALAVHGFDVGPLSCSWPGNADRRNKGKAACSLTPPLDLQWAQSQRTAD
jgi:hypothetical protein